MDEFAAAAGYHRKYATHLLVHGPPNRSKTKRGRPLTYGPDVVAALAQVWEVSGHLCGKRLQPNLVWMAGHLAQHGELEIAPSTMEKLSRISVSTVRRLLKNLQKDQPRLPRKGPEQANRFAREVPTKRIPWDEQQPGHFEVDLVHHSGISPSGQYVHTLQMVDVATGWSERVALLGRSYRVMQDGFERIQARLPVPILELHPDNDAAFFNNFLMRFWGNQLSRPYQKNDNRFVEQKNDTLVRAYVGYNRLDTVAQTNLVNQLYQRMWLYYNFFQPVMRLQEKTMVAVNAGRSRTRRRYDPARTPFDRLCDTDAVSESGKGQLKALRNATNPRQLREVIYDLLDQLRKLPAAQPGQTEDVHQTLFAAPRLKEAEDSPVTLSLERIVPVG